MRHTTVMRDRRVLIFVDESNVVSAVRALGRKLDWLKLRDHLVKASQGRELIEIVIYAGLQNHGCCRSGPFMFSVSYS